MEETKKHLTHIDHNLEKLSLEEKVELHGLYSDPQLAIDVRKKLEKVIFRMTPPTPLEYLDYRNGWITKAFYDSIYPHVKEDFIEILDEKKNYNQVVEYGAVRLGKSYQARMIIHYILIYIHCLRYPQLYYQLAPTTKLSIYIMSFVAEKVNQLLLDPIYKLLDMSPRFKRVKFQDQVAEEQYKNGLENIYWSKAGTGSKLTVESGLTLNIGTDFMSFIGSDLLFLTVSEINFFIEKAGVSHEEIFQLYSDGLARIKATVGNNYLGMVYLDSSANDEENPIERYITDELPKQNRVFFRQRAQWEEKDGKRISIGTSNFPIWEETGKTFDVFLGNKSHPPKIIENKSDLKELPKNLIIHPPIDLYDNFKLNILKAIKDNAGIPTRKENKFISDINIILNIFSNKDLPNIEGLIVADASKIPEDLIWNEIHSLFFSKYSGTGYNISRAHGAARFIGLDPATSSKGDLYGIAMLHKEWSRDLGKNMFVYDFCFGITGGETGINLSAIEFFILDLARKGQITIASVSVDTHQSKQTFQNLNRQGVITNNQSVDRDINPYTTFQTYMINEQIKTGKNIFLKNNLDSLITTTRNNKEVIDHTSGKTEKIYNGNFELSKCGINMKDCSDAACQAFWAAVNDKTHPSAIYEDENVKFSEEEDKTELISKSYKQLRGIPH